GLLVDHLLQDLLIDPELLEQLLAHVAAVRRPICLELSLVGPPEFPGGDFVALDFGDHVARGGVCAAAAQKVRDIEDDKRQADQAKAPFEPSPVPAHPVEHRHWDTWVTVSCRRSTLSGALLP